LLKKQILNVTIAGIIYLANEEYFKLSLKTASSSDHLPNRDGKYCKQITIGKYGLIIPFNFKKTLNTRAYRL
jgi:hypothetical protein